MKKRIRKILLVITGIFLLLGIALFFLAKKDTPPHITYGMSFNTPYVRELGLDSDTVFDAFIDELGVRHFRLAAHWTLIEPKKDVFDFSWLDSQMKRVEGVHGEVIFGLGRRLPRWPECHDPPWAKQLSWEDQKSEIREYIQAVIERYKDSPVITYWQVENEPYLGVFATEFCGALDEDFLKEEIALVRSLDPTRPILVTDSGNLGIWKEPYKLGDAFGTSVYVYFWNPELGQFKTILPPWFYRVKENMLSLIYGEKPTFLIELALEPWLVEPVTNVPLDVQYTRMDITKFNEIIAYARETRFATQYLWGGEWWYWLRAQGDPDMWNRGKELFNQK